MGTQRDKQASHDQIELAIVELRTDSAYRSYQERLSRLSIQELLTKEAELAKKITDDNLKDRMQKEKEKQRIKRLEPQTLQALETAIINRQVTINASLAACITAIMIISLMLIPSFLSSVPPSQPGGLIVGSILLAAGFAGYIYMTTASISRRTYHNKRPSLRSILAKENNLSLQNMNRESCIEMTSK